MTARSESRRFRVFHEVLAKHPANSPGRCVLYETLMWACNIAAILFYRVRCFGSRRVPHDGPLVIVSNHQSFLDPPLVGLGVAHRHLDYIARIGLFRFRPLGRLIWRLNAIPIRQDESDTAAIREALRRLSRGSAVVGTRSEDGSLGQFKRGVAVLLRKARCPVVPAAVEGTLDAWPRWRPLPRIFGPRVGVIFGDPIDHETLFSDGPDAALSALRKEIESLRADLHARLANASRSQSPPPGPSPEPGYA